MAKVKYNYSTDQQQLQENNELAFTIPAQNQLAKITLRVTFDLVTGATAPTIDVGGIHNILERLEVRLSGSNAPYDMRGVMVPVFYGMQTRSNPDNLVNLRLNAANSPNQNGATRTLAASSTYKVVVDFPIPFANYGGIRESDTLQLSDIPGSTFQVIATPTADFDNIFSGAGTATFNNVTAECVLEQFANLNERRPNIPTAGSFLTSQYGYELTAKNVNRVLLLNSYLFYHSMLIGIFNSGSLKPSAHIVDVLNKVTTSIGNNNFRELTPREIRNQIRDIYGALADFTDIDYYMPLDFTATDGRVPKKLSDCWLTNNNRDTKLVVDQEQSTGNELVLVARVFQPANPAAFVGNLTGAATAANGTL